MKLMSCTCVRCGARREGETNRLAGLHSLRCKKCGGMTMHHVQPVPRKDTPIDFRALALRGSVSTTNRHD